jgi:aminopeptidase N
VCEADLADEERTVPFLTRTEAAERARLLDVTSYDIDLDLTGGEDSFRSRTTVQFRCREPGTDSFLELQPAAIHRLEVNGERLDPDTALDDNRLALRDLQEHNQVSVDMDARYSRSCEGLHRFVDPADESVYIYGNTFLNHAQKVFACFDQPDLKAPVRLQVSAPADWTVAANGAAESVGDGRWTFGQTPPLATYFVTLVAGPYHAVTDDWRIPLGVLCRRSLAPHLEADLIFELTRASFDRLEQLFGEPYAFGKYDQVMVPEFAAGAMENPGCVTFRDALFVTESRLTDADREFLAVVIAHEMAHQWFGDLVTMRWWDDLWLNESFAEYLGYRVAAEATRFRDAWTGFTLQRKSWAYRADQLPTTHPVASQAEDAHTALLNFDGISYAKGASLLKQLVAFAGDEAFLTGLREYVADHRFGNTTLDDLLTAVDRHTPQDIHHWAQTWLRSTGVPTLRAEREDRQLLVTQTGAVRPHRFEVGTYTAGEDGLRRRATHEVEMAGDTATLDVEDADLLLLNDRDLTYAKLRLDEQSQATVARGLSTIDDSLARALCWGEMWDRVRDAELSASAFVSLVVRHGLAEGHPALHSDVLVRGVRAADTYAAPKNRQRLFDRLAGSARTTLASMAPGSDQQLETARLLASTAVTPEQMQVLEEWLDGTGVPPGLVVDSDLRWRLLTRLAVLGRLDQARLEEEASRDRTHNAVIASTAARAALPTVEAKERAWWAVMEATDLSNDLVAANCQGFWQSEQLELTSRWVEPFFAAIPHVPKKRGPHVTMLVGTMFYPSTVVEQSVVDLGGATLAEPDLDPLVRRALLDMQDETARTIRARAADTG